MNEPIPRLQATPWKLVIAVCIAVAMVGCSASSDTELPVAQVSGVVTLDGQPVQSAKVTFFPEQGPAASGEVDSEGRFRLTTYHQGDGAIVGKHVAIVTPIRAGLTLTPGEAPVAPTTSEIQIPPAFQQRGSSPLKYDVQSKGNDFQLPLTSEAE